MPAMSVVSGTRSPPPRAVAADAATTKSKEPLSPSATVASEEVAAYVVVLGPLNS